MKTSLTSGLTKQQKEEMVSSFQASAALRARYISIAEGKIDSMQKERVSKDGYAEPNWAFKQADACGYERALREFISLLQ